MSKAINVKAIREKYDIQYKTALRLLEKVKPVAEVPYATGTMRLYDPAEVEKVVQPYLKERDGKNRPAPVPTPAAEPLPHPQVDLTPLVAKINELLNTVEDLQKHVLSIHNQHVVLLRAVEKSGLDLSNKMDVLQQSIDMQETEPAAEDAAKLEAAPLKAPEGPKRKVTIIGLFDAHAAHIEREFKDAFDLRIYNIDQAKGPGVLARMKDSEAVFIMTRFVNHTVENLAKVAGVKPIRVNGGQTAIRDKLTELYCNAP